MHKIVFFGDSVTEAHRNIDDPDDLGQGFVFKLSQKFPDLDFYNRGISGQRVKDLSLRVEQDVILLNPDTCFIWIGVNDAWLPYLLNQPSSLTSFKKDYDDLIQTIIKQIKNIKLILIKPFAIPIKAVSIDIYQDVELFRNQTEQLAKKHNLDIIDIKKSVEGELRFMPAEQLFHDGIHPTPKGYDLITLVINKYIKEQLK